MSEAKCQHEWGTLRDANQKFIGQVCAHCEARRPSRKDIEYAEFHARRLDLAGPDEVTSEAGDGRRVMERQRPSAHGAVFGKAMADMVDKIAARAPHLDTRCSSCAFRRETIPNQMAGTLKDAFDCVMGIDDAIFMCHDKPGCVSGRTEPDTICAGYTMSKLATRDEILAMLETATASLDALPDDEPNRSQAAHRPAQEPRE